MEWLAAHESILIGVVWMLVLGPAVGNYACSVVYRLPLGKTPFERHPYCGSCNKDLAPIDLFPIISWFLTKGKCRYCRAKIPSLYTIIEIACGAVFIAYFLHFGMGEQFLLYTAYGVFVIILAGINYQQGWIAESIFGYAMTCVALARTLAEGTIYGWVQSGFFMLVLVLVLMRLVGNKSSPFVKPWVWWFVLMGTLVPLEQWKLILPIYIIKLLVPGEGRLVVYVAGALTLPLFLLQG